MDLFLLQLLIIFIPGIIWERLDSKYGGDASTQQWDILRRAFCFGLAAYLVTFCLFWCLGRISDGWAFTLFDFKKDAAFLDAVAFKQIASASVVALLCSMLWLYADKQQWLTKLFRKLHITKGYGDRDVWAFTFNSEQAEVEYVHLRDFEHEIVYAGWVDAWSDTGRQRELGLRNVIAYDLQGNKLFETPRVYLAFKPESVHIEFPYKGNQANGARNAA